MTDQFAPAWVIDQYTGSQKRFIELFRDFSLKNKKNYEDIQGDIHNIMEAIQLSLDSQLHQIIIEFANNLGDFFLYKGYWREAVNFLEEALESSKYLCQQEPSNERYVFEMASLEIALIGFLFLQGTKKDAADRLLKILENDSLENNSMIANSIGILARFVTHLQGENDDSVEFYQTMLDKLRPTGHLPLLSEIMHILATELTEQGEHLAAIDMYRKKLDFDRQTKDIQTIIDSMLGLAEIAQSAGLTDVADSCYQDAIEMADIVPLGETQIKIFKQIARRANEKDEYIKSVEFYEKALSIARQINNKWEIASILGFLAFSREELGEDITDLLEESLSISRELNNFDGMAMAMIQLGDSYQAKQDYERARNFYQQASDISNRVNNYPLNALCWFQIGDLEAEQANWLDAQVCYEKSLDSHKKCNELYSKAMVLSNLGRVYNQQKKYHEAMDAIQSSADIFSQLEDWEAHSEQLLELAELANKVNQVEDVG